MAKLPNAWKSSLVNLVSVITLRLKGTGSILQKLGWSPLVQKRNETVYNLAVSGGNITLDGVTYSG